MTRLQRHTTGARTAVAHRRSPRPGLISRILKVVDTHKLWKETLAFLKHYLGGLYTRSDTHHIFLMAGGLAFSLFVTIVPIVLLLFALLGMVLEAPAVANEVSSIIDRAVPYTDYASGVKELLLDRASSYFENKKTIGIIGLCGLFVAASGLFSSLRTIINFVFNLKSNEIFLIGKLRDIALLVALVAMLIMTLSAVAVTEFASRSDLARIIGGWQEAEFVKGLIQALTSLLGVFIGFFFLYYFIPFRKITRRVALVSAISAALLWEIARQAFGLYISNSGNLEEMYGSYALGLVVASWIYYTGIVFIVGAEIGQLYRGAVTGV